MQKRNQNIEARYEEMKKEFFGVKQVVSDLAEILDTEFPAMIVEQDKSHSHLVI